jgi:hypothetical protein
MGPKEHSLCWQRIGKKNIMKIDRKGKFVEIGYDARVYISFITRRMYKKIKQDN